MGEMRNAYKLLDGKREGEESLERTGRRWENITVHLTMYFQYIDVSPRSPPPPNTEISTILA
jgi:hypothetical protein